IVVGSGGRCFVSSVNHVTAVGDGGEVAWAADTQRALEDTPIAVAGSQLLRFEGFDEPAPTLVFRDEATGTVTSALPCSNGLVFPAMAPGRRIAAVVLSPGR